MEDQYWQKTINDPVEVTGIDHYNNANSVLFKPAEPNTGLVVVVNGRETKAALENAYRVRCGFLNLGRTIAIGKGKSRAYTVEHVFSSTYSLGIDNLRMELSGDTFPTTDNCGKEYFEGIQNAGIKTLEGHNKKLWTYNDRIHKTIKKKNGYKGSLIVGPSNGLTIEQNVNSSYPAIGYQTFTLNVTPENYRNQVMDARPPLRIPFPTKLVKFSSEFIKDIINSTRKHGVHGMTDKNYCWIFEHEKKYMNPEGFGVRYGGKEYTAHKIVDMLGTLALAGRPLVNTHLSLKGTNHQSEIYFVKELFSNGLLKEYNPKQKQSLTQKVRV